MADKYLINDGANLKQVEATVSSTGVSEAGDIPALDGTGKLDLSLMPTGIGPDTASIEASEDLVAGNFVNIFDDSGTTKVRKAIATGVATSVDGFVLSGVTSGNNALVYFEGKNTQLSGLTAGSAHYLSDTVAGGVTTTAPADSGEIVQVVGKAISATALNFEPGTPILI